MNSDLSNTSGAWFVEHKDGHDNLNIKVDGSGQVIAMVLPNKDGTPNWSDAAVMCASKAMLETLIAIQETLMTSKAVIDLEAMNDLISQTFEKIAAEIPG